MQKNQTRNIGIDHHFSASQLTQQLNGNCDSSNMFMI